MKRFPFMDILKLTLLFPSTVFENHKKISFNIAGEASYVFSLSGQKLINWRVFENLKVVVKQCYQTSHFYLDKIWRKMPKLVNLASF